jgi:hypothetical protein
MNTPYRQVETELRCGNGHVHTDPNAEGAYCRIPPCMGIEYSGRWDPVRKIERAEKRVEPGHS